MTDPRETFRTAGTAAKLGAAALAALAIGLAACGGDDGDQGTLEAASANAQSGAKNLGRFLLREDEEPGFRPGPSPGQVPASGDIITGVKAFVNEMRLTPADARRLRREDFIAFTAQPIRAPGSAGITNVALYGTAAGAKHSLAHELRPGVIRAFGPVEELSYFTVPGVPGARGYTASLPGQPASRRVGNLLWVQGRCLFVLGNQGPGPFAGPLSTGAQAIYERTNGVCP